MAYLNFTGFETGDLIETGSSGSGSGAACTIVTSPVRTGTYAMRCLVTTAANSAFRGLNSPGATGVGATFSADTFFCVFYFRYATKPASNNEPIATLSNSNVELRLASDGTLALYLTTTLIAAGTTALAADTWYRIEINVNNTLNTQEVRLNGSTEITGTTAIAANTSDLRLGKATNRNTNTVDFFYDDVAMSNSGWIGAGEAKLAIPIGDGAAKGWTNGTANAATEIDDVPNDGNTTYIQASAAEGSQNSTWDMQAYATVGVVGAIAAVKPMVYADTASTVGTSTVGLRRLYSGTGYNLTGLELSTSYQLLSAIDEDDTPGAGGSAFTSTSFDSAEVGMFSGVIAQTQRFTAAYLGVWSAGAAATTVRPRSLIMTGVGA